MGFFFKKKKDNSKQSLPSITNNSLPDIALSVHPYIRDLLWIANGPYKNWPITPKTITFEVMDMVFSMSYGVDEPSLINLNAPISFDTAIKVDTPDYYPSYIGLTPLQRGVYWDFLKNPFSGNYEISYVFILYYGLERHLYQGNYEKAIEVILKLRQMYKSSSFQSYSANSIVLTSLARKRPDFVLKLFEERDSSLDSCLSPEILLLCKLGLNDPLRPSDLMVLSKAFGFTNTNYIKKYPDLFQNALTELINNNHIYISDYLSEKDFNTLEKKVIPIYVNYSIDNRSIHVPAISTHPGLATAMKNTLQMAHDAVKLQLKDMRKAGTVPSESPKKPKKKKSFDEKRESELLRKLSLSKNPIDKHYSLLELHEFYYSHRESSPDHIALAEKYALEDISILPNVQLAYREEQIKAKNNYLLIQDTPISKKELAEMFDEKFSYNVPAFKRLCIIYEKDGLLDKSLEICDKAIKFYEEVEHEGELAAFLKRKSNLLKKIRES